MFLKKLTFIITLLLSLNINSQNQKKIDSLLQVYNELPNDTTKINIIDDIVEYYIANDTSKIEIYVKKQYHLANSLDFGKGKGNSFMNNAKYYRKKRNEDSVVYYFQKALKTYENIDFIRGQAEVRFEMADSYRRVHGYEAGIEFIQQNIAFFKKIKDSSYLATAYYTEANAHFHNDRYTS